MMFSKLAVPVFGAIVSAGLVALAPHQAAAQTAASTTKQTSAQKPAPKPAAAVQTGSPDYWTVKTNLPSQYTTERQRQARPASTQRAGAASQGVALETTSEFGRMPVQGAAGSSIGFTSGQSASSGRFSDGRTVPGIDPNTRSESSFVGLSLSSRSGIPIPVPPTPWNRTE